MRQSRILIGILSLIVLVTMVFSCAMPATALAPSMPATALAPSVGAIIVNATLDGSPWSGSISFIVIGSETISGSSVPYSFQAPAATWTIDYISGAPSGAALTIITPSTPQTLTVSGTTTFTLHFTTQAPPGIPTSGTINVDASLDGSSWPTLVGSTLPVGSTLYIRIGGIWYKTGLYGDSVPQSYSDMPSLFAYKVGFIWKGHLDATYFDGVSPSEATLTPGSTITFTVNFSNRRCGG